jgi:hypothetical protein
MIFIVVKFGKPGHVRPGRRFVRRRRGAAHANSEHFKQAPREMPRALASTPKILNQTIDATGWSEVAESTIN